MGKVLVADGVSRGRELLRVLLEHEGHEVFEAPSAEAAIVAARAILPDLILVDLELPGKNGYSAVRVMRRDEQLKNRVIMAVTASTRRSDRERLVDAGFSGYIAKPLVLRILREQLTQLAVRYPQALPAG